MTWNLFKSDSTLLKEHIRDSMIEIQYVLAYCDDMPFSFMNDEYCEQAKTVVDKFVQDTSHILNLDERCDKINDLVREYSQSVYLQKREERIKNDELQIAAMHRILTKLSYDAKFAYLSKRENTTEQNWIELEKELLKLSIK